MTKTLVLSEHDLTGWAERFARGEVPSAAPYGIDVLTQRGVELVGVRRQPGAALGRLGRKARAVVEHRSGYPWERAVRGARVDHDLVVALLEREGFAAARLRGKRVGRYRRSPVVIWSCWLADDLARANRRDRAELVGKVRDADLITHLSSHETEALVAAGLPPERLFPVTYGVSHRYYQPPPDDSIRDVRLLAVGQDRGRDYATLFAAVANSELVVDVVCKPENLHGLTVPTNVRVHAPVPLSTYRSLLRRAQVVVVPTREMAYPSGSSVALEAAASGCAVVTSATPAMAELFTDRVTARLIAPGAPAAWRDVLTELTRDPEQRNRLGVTARAHVVAKHNADQMWLELWDQLVGRGLVER